MNALILVKLADTSRRHYPAVLCAVPRGLPDQMDQAAERRVRCFVAGEYAGGTYHLDCIEFICETADDVVMYAN